MTGDSALGFPERGRQAYAAMGRPFSVAILGDSDLALRAHRLLRSLTPDPSAMSNDSAAGDAVHFTITVLPGGTATLEAEVGGPVEFPTSESALARLFWRINQLVINPPPAGHVLLHAAAASKEGDVVALAAPMESGKTTAVTALLGRGYQYITDEAVALNRETLSLTWIYPKPLGLDPGSWPLFRHLAPPENHAEDHSWHVAADEAGAISPEPPGQLRLVLLPHYEAGADTVPRPVSPAQAVLRLADSTFCFHDEPAANLTTLGRLASTIPIFDLAVDDLDRFCGVVDDLLG